LEACDGNAQQKHHYVHDGQVGEENYGSEANMSEGV
jgi:hypothetical protein